MLFVIKQRKQGARKKTPLAMTHMVAIPARNAEGELPQISSSTGRGKVREGDYKPRICDDVGNG